jgi:hypothetical protein
MASAPAPWPGAVREANERFMVEEKMFIFLTSTRSDQPERSRGGGSGSSAGDLRYDRWNCLKRERGTEKRKLQHTGIERYFDVIVVSEDAGVAKPHRDIFLIACRRARCAAQQCIYVGDRLEQDALASSAAGMRGFWLDRKNSQSHSAVDVIGSLAELSWKLERRIAV